MNVTRPAKVCLSSSMNAFMADNLDSVRHVFVHSRYRVSNDAVDSGGRQVELLMSSSGSRQRQLAGLFPLLTYEMNAFIISD